MRIKIRIRQIRRVRQVRRIRRIRVRIRRIRILKIAISHTYSTIKLTDKINKSFESGRYTGLILIDLQKAFDTKDHEILLKKMGCIGFSEK